jgi:hypothetical protein
VVTEWSKCSPDRWAGWRGELRAAMLRVGADVSGLSNVESELILTSWVVQLLSRGGWFAQKAKLEVDSRSPGRWWVVRGKGSCRQGNGLLVEQCTAVAGVSFSSIQLGLKCCREIVVSGSKFNLAIRGSEENRPANPGLVCRVALQTMRRKGQGPPKMGFLRECCNCGGSGR